MTDEEVIDYIEENDLLCTYCSQYLYYDCGELSDVRSGMNGEPVYAMCSDCLEKVKADAIENFRDENEEIEIDDDDDDDVK